MQKLHSILFVAIILFFSACSSGYKYYMINVDMTRVNLGMTKDQVLEKIGKPNNIIAAQRLPEGDLEILEYMRIEQNSYTEKNAHRPIWVYFLNNELIEWGPGEDWQVDQAMKERALERFRNRVKNNP